MRGKIIEKLPAPSNFFVVRPVYINTMKREVINKKMRSLFSLLWFLFWPMSPKKLQPIRVAAPSTASR
jgi:hypothetical protein